LIVVEVFGAELPTFAVFEPFVTNLIATDIKLPNAGVTKI
jgi:hypothetical protein